MSPGERAPAAGRAAGGERSSRWREVPPAADWVAMEGRVLEFWREGDVFRRTLDARRGAPPYVFYEGPPTANGRPGAHHVFSRVNSTEEFGAVEIRSRARGADVTTLQQRLREAGVYPKKGKLSGVVDKKTEKAIARYQKRYKLPKTGIVDRRMVQRIVGRLVADLSSYRVSLIRNGKVVVRYPIAKGQPAYPTPTGDYEIIDKQVDPTWTPPDSPWAAELASIPPGPGNPLGTRWIGTSAPAVGFHGTYADYSVGTAASHGCMRMHIPDVEAFYDMVTLGMKVQIRP